MFCERIDSSYFTWSLWRGGTLFDLGVRHYRTRWILSKRDELMKYAIGWCPAEELICRPKLGRIAVMFQKDETIFWTHLERREFDGVFNCEKGKTDER